MAEWCAANDTATVFIDPGSPWQNAWIESFNSRFRDELLNGWQFDSLLEARILVEDWRIDYNTNRPHSAHGDLTPAEFARQNGYQPERDLKSFARSIHLDARMVAVLQAKESQARALPRGSRVAGPRPRLRAARRQEVEPAGDLVVNDQPGGRSVSTMRPPRGCSSRRG